MNKTLMTILFILVFCFQNVRAQEKQSSDINPTLNEYFYMKQKAIETENKFMNTVQNVIYEYSVLDSLEKIYFEIEQIKKSKTVSISFLNKMIDQNNAILRAKEVAAEAQQESDIACSQFKLLNNNYKPD
ncbi:MAG: hypothetical protein WAV23_01470 [Minisyncoccia bacterium]